jgi:hypothetical protein
MVRSGIRKTILQLDEIAKFHDPEEVQRVIDWLIILVTRNPRVRMPMAYSMYAGHILLQWDNMEVHFKKEIEVKAFNNIEMISKMCS